MCCCHYLNTCTDSLQSKIWLQYVTSPEEKKKILRACHVDSTAGHMGRERTYNRLKERFMWTGMYKDVKELACASFQWYDYWILFLQSQLTKCDVCQHMNWKLTTGTPQLNPIPVKCPWHMIGIDFIGPISPTASDGSRYILTVCDYFTKSVGAVPSLDKSAPSVANELYKVCMWWTRLDLIFIYCYTVIHVLWTSSCNSVWQWERVRQPAWFSTLRSSWDQEMPNYSLSPQGILIMVWPHNNHV